MFVSIVSQRLLFKRHYISSRDNFCQTGKSEGVVSLFFSLLKQCFSTDVLLLESYFILIHTVKLKQLFQRINDLCLFLLLHRDFASNAIKSLPEGIFANLTSLTELWAIFHVIFQKRVRVFHRGFKHEKTDESTRPQAEFFYCFRVFETLMKHEARVFEITSPTKEN